MEVSLQRILDAHQLLCGAVINSDGDVLTNVGNFYEYNSAGLVSSLIGSLKSTKAILDSVQGDEVLFPRIWSQGDEFAFVDRAGELTIVLFGRGIHDARQLYRLSLAVSRSITAEFVS